MAGTRSTTEGWLPVWLLGLPLSPAGHDESESAVLAWARESRGTCQFVATSNVDFLVKALTWSPGGIRHPELVDVLRTAAMNTADGMPLVWAARLLGGNIPARVSGSDLVPSLARSAAKERLPVFLLGGAESVTARAAEILQKENPDLIIAGVDCPFVFTEGGKIAFEAEKDRAICEKINASGARILLIGFGNPKQEMWFQRNCYRLQPGVALGVGGTFNFVAGEISRAPEWMQRAGLEWVFRFLEEPGRLWKRYAVGLAKFSCITAPPLIAHLLFGAMARGTAPHFLKGTFFSESASVRVLALPERLVKATAEAAYASLADAWEGAVVLDASRCRFVDAAGFGMLWRIMQEERGRYLFAPSLAFRTLSRLHRAADFLSPFTCRELASLIARLAERFPSSGCFVSIEGTPDETRVSFLGGLTASDLSHLNRDDLVKALGNGNVILDLSYCPRIDGDGLALLMRLRRYAMDRGFRASVENPTQAVARSIEVAGLAADLLASGSSGRR